MKRRGRKRPHAALVLPAEIFQALRAVGFADQALSKVLGIPRPTITHAAAGNSVDMGVSFEELARLKAFAAQKAAEIRVIVAALDLY